MNRLDPWVIAIIGSGPRGLSVLERLAARMVEEPPWKPVELRLIDAEYVGTGRIWRTSQPAWFLMNAIAGDVSAFSGVPDAGPVRPGAGPSLAEWWEATDPEYPGPNNYAPRALYGMYMQFVLRAIRKALPPNAVLRLDQCTVCDIEPDVGIESGYLLRLTDGRTLRANRIVLASGHATPELSGDIAKLSRFAANHADSVFFRGDSAADMPLDELGASTHVGTIGLGLSFFDVMAALTIGRGGKFESADDGSLVYRSSGTEPILFGGSRSGMPVYGRVRNQRSRHYGYSIALLTSERASKMRAVGNVDFGVDVIPWLMAEINLVYYETELRRQYGSDCAQRFRAEVVDGASGFAPPNVVQIAAKYGLAWLPPVDLGRIARPFTGMHFDSPAAFEQSLLDKMEADYSESGLGNIDSPIKAALGILSACRPIIRSLVDYSGLTPVSHRYDFNGWYVPVSSVLTASPPRFRIAQAAALIRAGILHVVGPEACYVGDGSTGKIRMWSPVVAGSAVQLDALIDARIPSPNLMSDSSQLTRRLIKRGLLTELVNGCGPEALQTGGVAVKGPPFHPMRADDRAEIGMYVLGQPTEHTRWFMLTGSGSPGFWSDFVRDADCVAADALKLSV